VRVTHEETTVLQGLFVPEQVPLLHGTIVQLLMINFISSGISYTLAHYASTSKALDTVSLLRLQVELFVKRSGYG
jgi:hypothetical protein